MNFRFSIALPCLALALSAATQTSAVADEIHLKNGDKITGAILKRTAQSVTVKTDALGTLTIEQAYIKKTKTDEEILAAEMKEKEKNKPKLWNNELELGYTQTGGNTENQSGTGKLSLHRKTDDNEFNVKAQGHYGSSSGKINSKKYYGMTRYAFSFGEKKWYNFYKFEADRDRFSNIDYRLIPQVGIGHWYADYEDFKLMGEVGIGYEHTNYRDATDSSNEAILVPRGFFERKLTETLTFKEDLTLYPSLSEFGEYRVLSETSLTNTLNESLALRLTFIDEFNSDPQGDTEKNDFQINSSIVYSF